MEAFVRLYTIQTPAALQSLCRTGTLSARAEHQSDIAPLAYRWMREQMCDRIGPPKHGDQVPLWAWAHETTYSMVEIRRHWQPLGIYCQLEIELDEAAVLLSNFEDWHVVMMEGYLARDGRDFDLFHKRLDRLVAGDGPARPNSPVIYGELPSPLQREIRQSWQRIFEPHLADKSGPPSAARSSVEACFWQIERSQVIDMVEFISQPEPEDDD